eukprot:764514-Hanusia_phi.AAC.3
MAVQERLISMLPAAVPQTGGVPDERLPFLLVRRHNIVLNHRFIQTGCPHVSPTLHVQREAIRRTAPASMKHPRKQKPSCRCMRLVAFEALDSWRTSSECS